MRSLLQLLRTFEPAVEADLQRYYNLDYRERWGGSLSLRRIRTMLVALPAESMLARKLRPEGWTIEAHLLDDIRIQVAALTGKKAKPHPTRPKGGPRRQAMTPARRAKLDDARRRAARRRRELARAHHDDE